MVPVQELTQKHLVSEYREIARIPGNLNRWINRKSKPSSLLEIPLKYVLGTGHVLFFLNKFKFLKNRFEQLVDEMLKRGYNPTYRDSSIFDVEEKYFNDYVPTEEAVEINRARIQERLK